MNSLTLERIGSANFARCSARESLLSAALELLFRAYGYARDLGTDVWEFAVDIDEFRGAHISKSELRWLLGQGYAKHADEVSAPGIGKRQFRLVSSAAITNHSCFVISEAGAALFKEAATEGPSLVDPHSTLMISNGTGALATVAFGRVGIPSWNTCRRELSFNGQIVKRFRSPAPNQFIILEAFESHAWPTRIVDPLPAKGDQCPKRRLHDAIKCLNRSQSQVRLRFGGDGSGRGVLWEIAN